MTIADIVVPEIVLAIAREWKMDVRMVEHIYSMGFCDGRLKLIQEQMKSELDALQMKAAVND